MSIKNDKIVTLENGKLTYGIDPEAMRDAIVIAQTNKAFMEEKKS